jgi:hypothetical protein
MKSADLSPSEAEGGNTDPFSSDDEDVVEQVEERG